MKVPTREEQEVMLSRAAVHGLHDDTYALICGLRELEERIVANMQVRHDAGLRALETIYALKERIWIVREAFEACLSEHEIQARAHGETGDAPCACSYCTAARAFLNDLEKEEGR